MLYFTFLSPQTDTIGSRECENVFLKV